MQYRRCTYYDDCAITSVFLFCKSEKLEEQKFAIKFTFSYFTFFFAVLCFVLLCLMDLDAGATLMGSWVRPIATLHIKRLTFDLIVNQKCSIQENLALGIRP